MSEIKILIVEDERIIAKNLSRKLKKLGYIIVDIVSDGESAIKSASSSKPDLILMDIALEGDIDGIEAAAIILTENDIPVVYLSAYSDDEHIERATMVGCYGYLVKPFNERELHTTIKVALSKHQDQVRNKNWLRENLQKYQATSSLLNAMLNIGENEKKT